MKKFKKLLLLFIGVISVGTSYAELEVTNISITNDTNSGVILSNSEENIDSNINSEIITYTYYYGQGCSHCANLDKYLTKVGGYDKLNIVKKEVYFNDQNREEMINEGKRLGLSESDIGVPFFIINDSGTETPLIGDGQIIENLKPLLGEIPENNSKPIVFTILIILAIIIPVFLIKLSNKS